MQHLQKTGGPRRDALRKDSRQVGATGRGRESLRAKAPELQGGGIPAVLGMGGGAVADGFFGEEGLLADATRDFGEFALVGTDGGEVIGLADEIEGAEGFPDLFVTGVDGGDFGASGYVRARDHEEGVDAAADGRAEFNGLLTVLRGIRRAVDLKLGDQAALVDGGAYFVGVCDAACNGSSDSGGLQEGDDVGAAGGVTETDEGKGGVAADHRGWIPEHLEKCFVEGGAGSVLAHDPGV